MTQTIHKWEELQVVKGGKREIVEKTTAVINKCCLHNFDEICIFVFRYVLSSSIEMKICNYTVLLQNQKFPVDSLSASITKLSVCL